MTLPNFFIAGTAKAGTTALAHFLKLHPQVNIPYKEPDYFSSWKNYKIPLTNKNTQKLFFYEKQEYENLYREPVPSPIRVDASISYLPGINSAKAIRKELPEAKVMIILRQPLDRAFSHFHFNVRDGRENILDFLKYLKVEQQRITEDWHPCWRYMELSKYPQQVQRYLAEFPKEQIKIKLYEDWNESPHTFWSELMEFLQIEKSFTPDFKFRANVTKTPKFSNRLFSMLKSATRRLIPEKLQGILRPYSSSHLWKVPSLDKSTRLELTNKYFREDVLQLQDMIKRDLTHWLC